LPTAATRLLSKILSKQFLYLSFAMEPRSGGRQYRDERILERSPISDADSRACRELSPRGECPMAPCGRPGIGRDPRGYRLGAPHFGCGPARGQHPRSRAAARAERRSARRRAHGHLRCGLWPRHARAAAALVLAPTLGRWAIVLLATLFPYGRASGLGAPLKAAATPRTLVLASLLPIAGCIALGPVGVLCGLLAGVVAVGFGRWLMRLLPGLTGDNYGAACELVEATVWLSAAPLARVWA
jgi:hypothetical protein